MCGYTFYALSLLLLLIMLLVPLLTNEPTAQWKLCGGTSVSVELIVPADACSLFVFSGGFSDFHCCNHEGVRINGNEFIS